MQRWIILALVLVGGCGNQPVVVPPPPPPTPHAVSLQWDDVCASTVLVCQYKIYRGTDPQALTKLASAVVSKYTDANVQGGQTYYYAVTAEEAIGESAQSNVVGTGVPQ